MTTPGGVPARRLQCERGPSCGDKASLLGKPLFRATSGGARGKPGGVYGEAWNGPHLLKSQERALSKETFQPLDAARPALWCVRVR